MELSGWEFSSLSSRMPITLEFIRFCIGGKFGVWRYIEARNLSFNPLYRTNCVEKIYGLKGMRYRSLGCKPCTLPIKSNTSTIDEIIHELETTKEKEHSGRAQDKEDTFAMEKLRSLGYT